VAQYCRRSADRLIEMAAHSQCVAAPTGGSVRGARVAESNPVQRHLGQPSAGPVRLRSRRAGMIIVTRVPGITSEIRYAKEVELFGADHADEDHAPGLETDKLKQFQAGLDAAEQDCYPPYDVVYQQVHDEAVATVRN
jgi:hypothetical protein